MTLTVDRAVKPQHKQTNKIKQKIVKMQSYCRFKAKPEISLITNNWYCDISQNTCMYEYIVIHTKSNIQSFISKQEVSSRKIIVEANRALLSLKKDTGIVKVSKWPDDGAVLTQEGPKCYKNWVETTNKWDQNDFTRVLRSEIACFGKSSYRLSSAWNYMMKYINMYLVKKNKKQKHQLFCIIAGWKCKLWHIKD